MTIIAKAYLDAQAYRWLRHDWRRYVQRASVLEKYYEEIERKYRPGQARVPAGSRGGGQWTAESGEASSVESILAKAKRLAQGGGVGYQRCLDLCYPILERFSRRQ